MRRIVRITTAALAATSTVLVGAQAATAEVAPSSAVAASTTAPDRTPPSVRDVVLSRDRVPASGGTVEVALRVVDASGLAADSAPTVTFVSTTGDVLPAVPLTRTGGDALVSAWTAAFPFTADERLGIYSPRLSTLTDTAGNTTTSGGQGQVSVGFGRSAPPASLAAVLRADGSIHLTWSAPLDDGGSPLLRYRVRTPAAGALLTTVDAGTHALDLPAGSLPDPTTARFTVAAGNAAGDSRPAEVVGAQPAAQADPTAPPATADSVEQPAAAPARVRHVRVAVEGRAAVVRWRAPRTDAARADAYEVRLLHRGRLVLLRHGAHLRVEQRLRVVRPAAAFARLAPGGEYVVQVRARTAAAVGPWSAPHRFRVAARPHAAG